MLEAISIASETGWGQMVAFGTLSAGIAHVLAGRIDRGIRLLENAISAYDARGEILYATIYKFSLAEIYLEMLTSRARPPISAIVRNLGTALAFVIAPILRSNGVTAVRKHSSECLAAS